jgi:SAM-dependent methyltransferase
MSIPPSRRDPYDELPYISMPITYSQPAHLAAQVWLHGLEAQPADAASVLEIGAASGGNIIPLAARFPRARFLGLDLGAAHVEIGRKRIADLGLANVALEQGDIVEADLAGQRFDYILCHGVYSWAPAEAQRAILRVCAESLTPNGVAAISYNVFPGWHARNVIRDICLEHTRDGGPPRKRVASVRDLLKQLAQAASDKDPYGSILKAEAARLATRPGSYILGELLAVYNQPFHVRDVIAEAATQGLDYLCEADLMSSAPEYFAPNAAARVRAIAGDDPVALEQYTDIFSGRTFRRSLFVRAGRTPKAPSPERLSQLHLTAKLGAPEVGGSGDPATMAVRAMLSSSYPGSAAASDLVAEAERVLGSASAVQATLATLYELLSRGRASASSLPVRFEGLDPDRPRLWAVARSDAASGQPWVTNLHHAPVLLNPVLRTLGPMMDGVATRADLARALGAAAQVGTLSEADLPDVGDGKANDRFAASVDLLVQHCARNALLDG